MPKRRNRLTKDLPGSGEGALFDCFKKQRKSMATEQNDDDDDDDCILVETSGLEVV